MNELYLYVSEQRSLLKVLKSMVGLPAEATTHQMLAAMREALDLAPDKGGGEGGGGEGSGGEGSGEGGGEGGGGDTVGS